MNKIMWHLQHQVTASLKRDHESWRAKKAEEMELAAVSRNTLILYPVSVSDNLRLMKQFSVVMESLLLDDIRSPTVKVNIPVNISAGRASPATKLRVQSKIQILGREKSVGHDEHPPSL